MKLIDCGGFYITDNENNFKFLGIDQFGIARFYLPLIIHKYPLKKDKCNEDCNNGRRD